MPILFEISYINPLMCEPLYVIVTLSELGFPRNGWHTSPVKSDFALVLTVGRVGLMARFVRTFVILHTSSSARLSRTFHPKFWFRRLKDPPHDDGGEEQQLPGSQRPQGSSTKWGESSRRGLEWVAFIVNFMIWDIIAHFFSQSFRYRSKIRTMRGIWTRSGGSKQRITCARHRPQKKDQTSKLPW